MTDRCRLSISAAFLLAAAFACGILAARRSHASPALCLAVFTVAAATTAVLLFLRLDRLSTVALLLSIAAAGAYDAALAATTPLDCLSRLFAPGGPAPDGAVMSFRAVLLDRSPVRAFGQSRLLRYTVRITRVAVSDRPVAASGTVLLDSADDLPCGARVDAVAFFKLPLSPGVPGRFDYRAHLANSGISCLATADLPGALRLVSPPPLFSPARAFAALRQALLERLAALRLNREGVIPAVLLADRSGLSDRTNDAFVRSGTMHLLSISGLHLAIVAGSFWWFLRVVGVPLRLSCILTVAVAVSYALLVGPRPPVVRSALMLTLFCVAVASDRPTRALSVVSAAAIAMLIMSPLELYDAGFQMSFIAVLGLFYLGVPLGHFFQSSVSRLALPLPGLARSVANMFGISLGAAAAVAPLGLCRFGVISFVSPFANLLLIPVTWIMVVAGFAAAGLSFVSMTLASIVALSASGAETSLVALAHIFSAAPLACSYLAIPLWLAAAMYAYLAVLSLAAARGKWLPQLLIAGLAAANAFAWSALVPPRERPPEIVVLDDAHGSAVVAFDGRSRALIFIGRKGNAAAARDLICPFLLSRRVSTVSLLVETAGADARIRDLLSERFVVANVVRQTRFRGSPDLDGLPRPSDVHLVFPGDLLRLPRGPEITFHAGRPIDFLAPSGPWREGLIADVRFPRGRAVIAVDATDACLAISRRRLQPAPDVLCLLNCAATPEMLALWRDSLSPGLLLPAPPRDFSDGAASCVALTDSLAVRDLRP